MAHVGPWISQGCQLIFLVARLIAVVKKRFDQAFLLANYSALELTNLHRYAKPARI